MKIILENVIKGETVTGVAKIMDGTKNVNNVPFNVSSKRELDSFCEKLLSVQSEFASVTNGEYTPTPVVVVEPTEVEKALQAVYDGKGKLEAKIITDAEYDALVANYKLLADKEVKTK